MSSASALEISLFRISWYREALIPKLPSLSHVEKTLETCPNLPAARADRGRLLLKLRREPEAITDLQAAETANPSEPSTHFLLAQAYRATGKNEQATAEMRLFSELDGKARVAAAERA